MPARIHALLVVRPDGADRGAAARDHLARTLDALAAQERQVDVLTIVVCGDTPPALRELISQSGAEGVIGAARSTGYAAALALASMRIDPLADAVWLLAQDTEPEPDALRRLAGALEQPSVWIAAPKVVSAESRDTIVSLGVSMTQHGRSIGLVDGQHDQGQHDSDRDVLATDVRGVLVRRGAWDILGGLDPALLGADDGLDLGVRGRLAGGRIALVPHARVAVAGDGVAGVPDPDDRRRRRRRQYAQRVAQLHRRLAYAPAAAVPLLWLALLPIALWQTVVLLVRKQPGRVAVEWAAALTVLVRLPSIARSRGRIREASQRSGTRVPWARLAPLRITRAELTRRFDTGDHRTDAVDRRGELGFLTGGGAWAVLGAAVLGAIVFVGLLAWPTLGGGGLLPLRDSIVSLWTDAAFGRRALGLDLIGPADPFAAVIALLGSLTPWNPSQAVVLLWVLALPLAMLAGWMGASRLTARPGLRIVGGIVWMLAPTFLTALIEGRPAAVLVHLLLPWLFVAGIAARHSWAAAGAASIAFAAIAACAPSLVPALLVLWVVLMVGTIATAARRVLHVVWVLVPTVVLFAPLLWRRGVRDGDWWAVLADPGVVFAVEGTPDGAGRAALAMGFPDGGLAGWIALMPELSAHAWILGAALAPLGVLALLSLLSARWRPGAVLVAIAVVGLFTAFAQSSLTLQFAGAEPVALWAGSGLSLAWLGIAGAALTALDTPAVLPVRLVQPWAAALAVAGVVAVALPGLSAPLRGATPLTNGPASSLPAFVAAEGRADPSIGTIVVTPLADGSASATVVWGASETLGGQTTLASARVTATPGDDRLAQLTADLVVPSAVDIASELGREGVAFVLLAPPASPPSGAATAFASRAEAAIDERAGFESVGETGRGLLWRVASDVEAPQPVAPVMAAWTGAVQAAVFAIALLLAIPTRSSRQEARRRPRVVGAVAGADSEPPRHDPDVVTDVDEAEVDA